MFLVDDRGNLPVKIGEISMLMLYTIKLTVLVNNTDILSIPTLKFKIKG